MGFVSVCNVLYDYHANGEDELEIREGDLVYILEKVEGDWWKAKKRAAEDEEEPVGLVPHNYVSQVSAKPSPPSPKRMRLRRSSSGYCERNVYLWSSLLTVLELAGEADPRSESPL